MTPQRALRRKMIPDRVPGPRINLGPKSILKRDLGAQNSTNISFNTFLAMSEHFPKIYIFSFFDEFSHYFDPSL